MKHKKKKSMSVLAAMLVIAVAIGSAPQITTIAYAANGDPAMAPGTAVLNTEVNTSSAQTLYYGGTNWYVIAYDGKDMNGTLTYENSSGDMSDLYPEGTVTLLSAGDLGYGKYNPMQANSTYAGSILESRITGASGVLSRFSAGEKDGITDRTLYGGIESYGMLYDSNMISGPDVENALLWPLSAAEADALDNSIRSRFFNSWWLRSPGIGTINAAVVNSYTYDVNRIGVSIYDPFTDYRCAFHLDQNSVLFTSAATDGKASGNVSADALKAQSDQTNSGDEWKVTLRSGHADFKISECTPAEKGVKVKYTGAKAGTEEKPEYISAVITDKPITDSSAKITYYGRIQTCTSASGTVTINTTGKLGDNDYLYVFNEQYNGDKKTDYASALQEVTITEPISVYTVTFMDGQGKTLKTEKVESGKAATAPADPKRSGYIFTGWDKDFSKVTGNMTVTAQWKKNAEPAPVTKIRGMLLAKMTAQGKSSLILTWNKVNDAKGYDIFFTKCGKNSLKKIRTIKGNKTFKWTKRNLKTKKAYKAFIKAYIMKNGKKTYVRKSPMIHAYTSGSTKKFTNAKSVIVKKTSVSLKAGKKYKIKARVTKLRKGKKLMPAVHAPKLRYISSNKKIATVSKSGKITAKAKGSCKVYVIAVNGAKRTVKVIVE